MTTIGQYNAFLRENTFAMVHGTLLQAAVTGAALERSLAESPQHFMVACSWFCSISAATAQVENHHILTAHDGIIVPNLVAATDPAHRDALRTIATAANNDHAAAAAFIVSLIDHVENAPADEARAHAEHALLVFMALCAYARRFHSDCRTAETCPLKVSR